MELLRELAEMPPDFPEKEVRSSAAERLMKNLKGAIDKRSEVDRRLDRIGSQEPGVEARSRFEATVE